MTSVNKEQDARELRPLTPIQRAQTREFIRELEHECQTYWDETLKPEMATKALRRKRDRLIRESDPYSLPDFPHASEEVRQAWLTYRQALRDLPSTTEDPSNPTWPEAPSSN